MDICGMFSIKLSIFQAESLYMYIKNIVLHGNATSELTATTTMTEKKKRRKEANKTSEGAAHFLAGFFAITA